MPLHRPHHQPGPDPVPQAPRDDQAALRRRQRDAKEAQRRAHVEKVVRRDGCYRDIEIRE
jgi:hypothetical protein